jgi:FimV-like protein
VEFVDKEAATRPAEGVKPGPSVAPATRPAGPTTAAAPPATAPRPAADPVLSAINLAKAYMAAGQKDKARAALAEALKSNPQSPQAPAALDLLKQLP